MKFNSTVSKFLTNKWVLNIVAVLALFNVIGYAVIGNSNAVIFFIIIGILTSYFSKNMIITLGVPLILVNLFVSQGTFKEGMENSTTTTPPSTTTTPPSTTTTPPSTTNGQKKMESLTNNQQEPKTGQGLQMGKVENASTENNAAQTDGGAGSKNGKNNGNKIDYATTVEEAYDNLNNILGSDGIQRLTADSQKLMQQQVQLAEAMKNMTPLIKSIEPMVQNLQGMMGQMDGKEGLGGIMDLAKKLMPAKSN